MCRLTILYHIVQHKLFYEGISIVLSTLCRYFAIIIIYIFFLIFYLVFEFSLILPVLLLFSFYVFSMRFSFQCQSGVIFLNDPVYHDNHCFNNASIVCIFYRKMCLFFFLKFDSHSFVLLIQVGLGNESFIQRYFICPHLKEAFKRFSLLKLKFLSF